MPRRPRRGATLGGVAPPLPEAATTMPRWAPGSAAAMGGGGITLLDEMRERYCANGEPDRYLFITGLDFSSASMTDYSG